MLWYQKIDVSEGIDINKTNICKFEEHICNKFHDLLTTAYSLKNIAILNGATFKCILMSIRKKEGLKRLNNSYK